MRFITSISVGAVALSLLATVASAGSNGLDGRSIKGLFPGYFEAKVQGYRVQFTGFGNGTLKGEAYGHQDQGYWSIKDNSLCVSWKEWTKGKTKCGVISQASGWYVASNTTGEILRFRRAMVAQQ